MAGLDIGSHLLAGTLNLSIQPVSRTRHAQLRWRRYVDYRFTATTILVPLSAPEIGPAALAFPLAIIQRDASWGLAAILGLLPEQNLSVNANGAWLASYVPAALRCYPFLIGMQSDGKSIMCVDEASGLVYAGLEGEPFFDITGQLSPSVARISTFLSDVRKSEETVLQACNTLVQAGVVEIWPISLLGEDGPMPVTGLYRVDEAALNNFDYQAFTALRRSGVQALAYAQILSMGNLPALVRRAEFRARAAAAAHARTIIKPALTLSLDDDATWDWSQIGPVKVPQ